MSLRTQSTIYNSYTLSQVGSLLLDVTLGTIKHAQTESSNDDAGACANVGAVGDGDNTLEGDDSLDDSDDDDDNDGGAAEALRRSRRRTVRHKQSKSSAAVGVAAATHVPVCEAVLRLLEQLRDVRVAGLFTKRYSMICMYLIIVRCDANVDLAHHDDSLCNAILCRSDRDPCDKLVDALVAMCAGKLKDSSPLRSGD